MATGYTLLEALDSIHSPSCRSDGDLYVSVLANHSDHLSCQVVSGVIKPGKLITFRPAEVTYQVEHITRRGTVVDRGRPGYELDVFFE